MLGGVLDIPGVALVDLNPLIAGVEGCGRKEFGEVVS